MNLSTKGNSMSNPFDGVKVISSYTRERAISDGVLRDVSSLAKESGFAVPTAMTAAAWAKAVAWSQSHGALQDETGRLWDVLIMAKHAAMRTRGRHSEESPRCSFSLYRVPNVPDATEATVLVLDMHVGPGDDGTPAITIMLEHED